MTKQPTLFAAERYSQTGDEALDQYFTPEWAAEALLTEMFPDITERDVILEPSCGRGAWLKAVPEGIQAVGVEIDAALAAEARQATGRRIIAGDFREIPIDIEPTLIVGNPPYKVRLLEEFLQRAYDLLPRHGRCGFLLSSYMLQTPATVVGWSKRWGLSQHLVPRTLFPNAVRPLLFVQFLKNSPQIFRGFALYRESVEVAELPAKSKQALVHGEAFKSCWRSLVEWALRQLGGVAKLADLYAVIGPHRISDNPWWQQKVRQTLQRHFVNVGRGEWSLSV